MSATDIPAAVSGTASKGERGQRVAERSHHSILLSLIAATAAVGMQAAQPAPQATATALVVGQVVDATAGGALSGAIVTIVGPSSVSLPRVLTGTDGRFVFRGLPPGAYRIIAAKSGYVEGAYGRMRPGGSSVPLILVTGERNGDVQIRLWRHAAISGTLVDEAGERQVGVTVRALRRSVVGGAKRFLSMGTAQTDDRGEFRLSGLVPGDYIVGTSSHYASVPAAAFRAAPIAADGVTRITPGPAANSLGNILAGDAVLMLPQGTPMPPAAGPRLSIYPPAYHPFSPGSDGASVITLRAGQEYEGADLQIAPVAGVRVSGSIAGPDGPLAGLPVRLVPDGASDRSPEADWLAANADRNGIFTFPVVPSGQYSLRVARGAPGVARLPGPQPPSILWADVPVSVGTDDIENLAVVARPGLRISGRVEFDGAAANRPRSLASINIVVEPVLGSNVLPPVIEGTTIDIAGEFTTAGVPAGQYYIRVPNSPSGWMFLAASLDGRDVTDVPLTVTSDTSGVVVRFTDRWSGIQGTVQGQAGPDRTALVIVFPTDLEAWGSSGTAPRRLRGMRTGRAGEYSLNLPPGDYYVLALPEEESADWQDPDFLHAASRAAAKVTVVSGDRRTVELRTRRVR